MRPEYAFIAFVLVLMLSGCTQQNGPITQEMAVKFVKDHMAAQYPGAVTDIYIVTQENDSWEITSKVIYGENTPCPNLSIVVYEYPKFGFVPTTQNNITRNCRVLGCEGVPDCKISTSEEAIIASHKLNNISEVESMIQNVGYDNVSVEASFYNSYLEQSTNSTYNSVWVVNWTPKSNYSVKLIRLVLNQTGGKVLGESIE